MATDLILGTAGHIDHGKTALVKALTGVDTDRLPEEKRRGITIELGFAELDLGPYRLGIVDVPGHERFVRTMLAGATGIDLALLVVAADDSVKPQTREHLDILRLLRLQTGVIAITKCDLADTAWIDLVEEEVRELTAGTFLADAPLVRTSATTGAGLEALRDVLAIAAQAAGSTRHRGEGPFRMAIDRAFTMPGHGTVVTGSVASGRTRTGDELVVEPGTIAVRVRRLQNHGRPVDEVSRGQRAAINLAGMHHGQFRRGHELASPGHLVASQRLSAWLELLPSVLRPLRQRARVRLHVGTAELMASVVILERDEIAPGDAAPVQLLLAEPAATVWGQPVVIRSESPVATIGGGTVLDPDAPKLARHDPAAQDFLRRLRSDEPLARAGGAAWFAGWRKWSPADWPRTAGVYEVERVRRALVERGELLELPVSSRRLLYLHREVFAGLSGRVETALAKMHDEAPLSPLLDRSRLAARLSYLEDDALLDVILERLATAGKIELGDHTVALVGRRPRLSKREMELAGWIADSYLRAGFQPPGIAELKRLAPYNQAAVAQLVELLSAEGRLVRISPEYCLHADCEKRMQELIRGRLAASAGLTVSEIREFLGTTRKYAVPLCEYLDRVGLTVRQGDLRVLKDSARP